MIRMNLAAAALALAVGTAEAATVTAVYEGSVSGLTSAFGDEADTFFGVPASSLVGLDATATFVYDTDNGTRSTGPDFDSIGGFPELDGFVGAIISATLDIGGVQRTLAAEFFESILVRDGSGADPSQVQHTASDNDPDFAPGFSFYQQLQGDFSGVAGIPANLEQSFVVSSPGMGTGSFQFSIEDGDGSVGGVGTSSLGGFLAFDRLTVTVENGGPVDPQPIPLPASALLLAGALGSLGAIRRRAG